MSSKILTEFMFEVPELITDRNKSEDRKIFCYLAIFKNQLLCTDYHCFCKRYGGVCSYNNNCGISAFHRKMEIIFENATQCYLKRDFRKFCQ